MTERSGAGIAQSRARLTLRSRLACIPVRERFFLFVVLACPVLPPAFMESRACEDWSSSVRFAGFALTVSAAAILIFEWPRTRSVGGYLKQLQLRFERAQNDYDVALRRRLEEEHHETRIDDDP